MKHNETTPELIMAREVLDRVPYSANHLRRLEARGEFPKRIHIGKRRVAWLRSEIEQWLSAKVEAR